MLVTLDSATRDILREEVILSAWRWPDKSAGLWRTQRFSPVAKERKGKAVTGIGNKMLKCGIRKAGWAPGGSGIRGGSGRAQRAAEWGGDEAGRVSRRCLGKGACMFRSLSFLQTSKSVPVRPGVRGYPTVVVPLEGYTQPACESGCWASGSREGAPKAWAASPPSPRRSCVHWRFCSALWPQGTGSSCHQDSVLCSAVFSGQEDAPLGGLVDEGGHWFQSPPPRPAQLTLSLTGTCTCEPATEDKSTLSGYSASPVPPCTLTGAFSSLCCLCLRPSSLSLEPFRYTF